MRRRTSNGAPLVYLTFDDGPHPEVTPRILDTLQQHNALGSFFLIGEQAERFPELVERLLAEGHQIGNHTATHCAPWKVSFARWRSELMRCDQVLIDLGASRPWYRPPWGQMTVRQQWYLWRESRPVAFWSRDPKDCSCSTPEPLKNHFRNRPPAPGDILLLHDDQPHTADWLPWLLTQIRSVGLSCDRLDTRPNPRH